MTTTRPTEGELADYRAEAIEWLEKNLEPRDTAAGDRGIADGGDLDPAEVTAQRKLQRKLFDAGYAGISWPVEYGGQGLHQEYERTFQREARRFSMPDLGNVGGATLGVCAPTMLTHASPEFLRKFIPEILAGDAIVSQFFSDPEAGSDLAGVRTSAVRDGDTWILNGSKIWSSGAYYADYGMCLARTNWDVPKHRGLTWFLVPVDAEGVTIERIRQINGNAEFCQEFFDDVRVSHDNVIGEIDEGWAVARTMLLYERGAGVMGAGRSKQRQRGLAPDLTALAEEVGAADDPVTQDLIARAHVNDLASKALGSRLGEMMSADPGRAASLASYSKLASGIFDPIRAEIALAIGGPAALAWERNDGPEAKAARGILNSRFMAIAGGTSQMQRNTISEKVLGLPREPSFDSGKPFRDVLRDAQTWTGRPPQ